MSDPLNLQPSLERVLGRLQFQLIAAEAQANAFQQQLAAKTQEAAALKLALEALQPKAETSPLPSMRSARKAGNGGVPP